MIDGEVGAEEWKSRGIEKWRSGEVRKFLSLVKKYKKHYKPFIFY
jgi:hypothetical protein